MALRSTLSNLRLMRAQRPMLAWTRSQSTLDTGKTVVDPQIGDYPNLPHNSNQSRAPFGWWDNQDRRNFGETVHEEDEILGVWGPDLHTYNPYKALGQVLLFAGVIAGFAGIVYKTYPERPAIQRTYPYDGLKKELGYSEDDVSPRGARTE